MHNRYDNDLKWLGCDNYQCWSEDAGNGWRNCHADMTFNRVSWVARCNELTDGVTHAQRAHFRRDDFYCPHMNCANGERFLEILEA